MRFCWEPILLGSALLVRTLGNRGLSYAFSFLFLPLHLLIPHPSSPFLSSIFRPSHFLCHWKLVDVNQPAFSSRVFDLDSNRPNILKCSYFNREISKILFLNLIHIRHHNLMGHLSSKESARIGPVLGPGNFSNIPYLSQITLQKIMLRPWTTLAKLSD